MEKFNALCNFIARYWVVKIVLVILAIVWLVMIILKRFDPKFIKKKRLYVRNIGISGGYDRNVHWTNRIVYLLVPWANTCTLKIRGLPEIRIKGDELSGQYMIANYDPKFYILRQRTDILYYFDRYLKGKHIKDKASANNKIFVCEYYVKSGTLVIYNEEYQEIWFLMKK